MWMFGGFTWARGFRWDDGGLGRRRGGLYDGEADAVKVVRHRQGNANSRARFPK